MSVNDVLATLCQKETDRQMLLQCFGHKDFLMRALMMLPSDQLALSQQDHRYPRCGSLCHETTCTLQTQVTFVAEGPGGPL